MLIRIVFLFILFFPVLWGYSQEDTLFFQLDLEDEKTGQTIESAQITFEAVNNPGQLKRDVNSGDTLSFIFDKEEIWKVTARTAGYITLDTTINTKSFRREIKRSRIVSIDLLFRFDGQYTGEVDINSAYKPLIKFQSKKLSVSDYVVINENQLLLLTYPERLKKGSRIIWYENDEVKGSQAVTGTAIELCSDFRSSVYLRCEERDFQISPSRSLTTLEVDRKKLDNYFLPIIDSLEETRLYFSNYAAHYPAFDYFMVNRKDTIYTKIRHIEDNVMMEQYRAEYKWADVRTKLWAWDMESETGIDREVWVGANVFTNSIYYEPPIGDFIKIDQDILVFDYYNDLLLTFDAYNASKLDSVPINFHEKSRKTGWEEKVIQDPITQKIYTFFDDAGYMIGNEIDPDTGELINQFKLHYRYVENIQIYNGKIFYIYRPFESPQKKYLYYEYIGKMMNKD